MYAIVDISCAACSHADTHHGDSLPVANKLRILRVSSKVQCPQALGLVTVAHFRIAVYSHGQQRTIIMH